jgi:hypothetical protein
MRASVRRDTMPAVRLALIGPAAGDAAAFARMAEVVLNDGRADRAIYLGTDDALESAVRTWACELVGPDASDAGTWDRALAAALQPDPAVIDAFVRTEKARLRLKSIESVPALGQRAVEVLAGRLAVIVHDRSVLDEDDVYSASLLAFGLSDGPVLRPIGPRWFLSPGPIGHAAGGAIVLDDASGDIEASFYDVERRVVQRLALTFPRSARVSVQEGKAP